MTVLQFCPLQRHQAVLGSSKKSTERKERTNTAKSGKWRRISAERHATSSFFVFPSLPFCQGTPRDTSIYDVRERVLRQSVQRVRKFRCCRHPHSPLRNRRFQSSWMGETDPQRNWELLILLSNGTIRTGTMSSPDCSFQEVGVKFKACFSVLVSSTCRELGGWGRKDFSHREIAMVDFFDLQSVLLTFSLWNFRTHRSFPFPSNVIRYTLQQAGPTLDCTSEHSGVHSDTVLGLAEGAESSVGKSAYCIGVRTWIHSPVPLCNSCGRVWLQRQ